MNHSSGDVCSSFAKFSRLAYMELLIWGWIKFPEGNQARQTLMSQASSVILSFFFPQVCYPSSLVVARQYRTDQHAVLLCGSFVCCLRLVAKFRSVDSVTVVKCFLVTGHSHCLGGSTSAGVAGGGAEVTAGEGEQQQRLSQLRHPRQPANTGSCASNR